MFVNSNSFNFVFAVHLEDTIVDEGVLFAFVCVVDTHYDRVVLSNILSQTESDQVVKIKLNAAVLNLLSHSDIKPTFLYVISLVRSVEHLRDIISILLLSHTSIDPDYSFGKGVNFEFNIKICCTVASDTLKYKC